MAIIPLALALALSAAVHGAAVLRPVAGPSSAGAVGLVPLAINLLVPAALFLLEKASRQAPAKQAASVGAAFVAATSPLLLAPLLGVALVLFRIYLPALLLSPLRLLGQTTTSVATFAVGPTLAAHQLSVSRVVFGALARLIIQPALILGLLLVFLAFQAPARHAR